MGASYVFRSLHDPPGVQSSELSTLNRTVPEQFGHAGGSGSQDGGASGSRLYASDKFKG